MNASLEKFDDCRKRLSDAVVRMNRMPPTRIGSILAGMERSYILHALQHTGWRAEGRKGAVVLLGLNPSTRRSRMRKFGIKRTKAIFE